MTTGFDKIIERIGPTYLILLAMVLLAFVVFALRSASRNKADDARHRGDVDEKE